MTPAGWILLIASWSAILFWTAWCFRRVLTSTRHWANPEEEIAHLHHGEFDGEIHPARKETEPRDSP